MQVEKLLERIDRSKKWQRIRCLGPWLGLPGAMAGPGVLYSVGSFCGLILWAWPWYSSGQLLPEGGYLALA